MIGQINIEWKDNNHAHVQDPALGREFGITVRPKENMFVGGNVVKPRLYISGNVVDVMEEEIGHNNTIKWAKEYFGSALEKVLNKRLKLRFSSKAGCSCGCSPGFIIEEGGESVPFDIWMDAK